METRQRPRILLIKPILPYPPDQGTKVLSFNLIRALKRQFDVTVLSRILSPEEEPHARSLEQWCSKVVTVFAPNRRSIWHKISYRMLYFLKSVFLRRSMKSLYDCPGAFLNAAKRLSREDFDLVILEYWQLQRAAAFFPDNKVILLTHDVDMLVNRQNALLERNLFVKIHAIRRWLLEQKEEIRAYRIFRRILVLTERDKIAVKKISGDQSVVEVFPFGLEPEVYRSSEERRNEKEILFLGAMAASFNRDALDFFIRRIYPRIDHIEGLSITIVGGELPNELTYFASMDNVEIIGKVQDVRPFLHRATCMVVPLRFGGGLRIRILEAMCAGLPVVCSSVAIAGMPFEPGEDFLLAETPDEYAKQLERLLDDSELSETLSLNARRKVIDQYGADMQAHRLEQLVQKIIDSE